MTARLRKVTVKVSLLYIMLVILEKKRWELERKNSLDGNFFHI